MNIAEIGINLSDLVSEDFDRDEFIFRFIEIYNAPKSTLDKLRKGTQNKADLAGDLLWQRKLYFRVAEPGQSSITLDMLKERKPAKKNKPRFIIATDGKEFSALDTKADESIHCDFDKLNDHFDFFLPLAGIDKYKAVEENKADIKAAGRLHKFYNEIMQINEGWHTEEKRHALNQFMTRVLFCLFSEDTGSFKKGLFAKAITEYGGDNGEELQSLLTQIFDAMNTPDNQRGDIPAHIDAFPYVNGGLFADKTEIPKFNKRAKRVLIEAARDDWQDINPDIFGSMIQAIVDNDMRGDLGMHYTSVPNIMKVLLPLFLMSLEEELADAHGHREERARLKKLLSRLSKIRVFDPACGSGNFLIIAYRELRSLEMRIFQREDELDGGQAALRWESGISLSNFYGIELADFAAETAKLSLWIAEYQMNQRFKSLFGESPPDFPLKEGGHITHDNALRVNWMEACPPADDEEVETYIVGNPPYLGSTYQNSEQKDDMRHVFSEKSKKFKSLDYVSAWYVKGAEYCAKNLAQCAFVATNSICQGQQVSMLWPLIFDLGIEISFAHQSFKWSNLAAKNAGVTCIIVGIRQKSNSKKRLFYNDLSRIVNNIGPYLIEMDNTIVYQKSKPENGLPEMLRGNQPTDGGNLILSPSEKEFLIEKFPDSSSLIKKFCGANELIKGLERWCLWITDKNLPIALSIPPIQERIGKVRDMRLSSKDDGANKMASRPHQFREMYHSKSHTIIAPVTSSENRAYLPCDIMDSNVIISNLAFALYDTPVWLFSLLSSKMNRVWMTAVGGQLETRTRFSNTLVYNTYPIPELSNTHKQSLEDHAWSIKGIRENYVGKTLAWLYDQKTMPAELLAAHQALDDTLEKIYIGRPFKDDTERLEHLFKLYAKMTAPNKQQLKKEAANA